MFDHDAPTVLPASAGPVTGGAPGGGPGVEERLDRVLEDVRGLAAEDLSRAGEASISRMLSVQKGVDAAMSAWRASLVAACDEGVVERSGAVDKAGLVRARLGVSGREAKREANLADGLAELPGTREALREGRIGADHARRIAGALEDAVLGDGAAVEQTLLGAAERLDPDRFGRHVRRRVEEARSAAEQLSREREAHRRRMLSIRDRKDGLTEVNALLPTLGAEQFKNALAGFMTFDGEDVPDEDRRTFVQRSADAFMDMVQAAQTAPRDGSVGRARADVTVMIPWEVWTGGEGIAEIGGRVVCGEVARQAACDANISRLLAGPSSQPLDLGRSSRDWSVAQRRAIVARDGHCRFVGCDRPAAWCHAHHIEWWRDGGRTDVSNGLLLCQRHHTAVHVGGWKVSLEASTGVATWTSPRGEEHVTHPEGALHTLLETGLGADPPPREGPGDDRLRRVLVARESRARYVGWSAAPSRTFVDVLPARTLDQLALAGTTSRAP